MYTEDMVIEKTLERIEEIGNDLKLSFKLVKIKRKYSTFNIRCTEYPDYDYIVAYEKKNPFYSNKLIESDVEVDHMLSKFKKDIINYIEMYQA